MWEINNVIFCIVLFEYERVGSDEQENVLVCPYEKQIR